MSINSIQYRIKLKLKFVPGCAGALRLGGQELLFAHGLPVEKALARAFGVPVMNTESLSLCLRVQRAKC